MSTTLETLSKLKSGKSRRIKGQLVSRDGGVFDVDGDSFDLITAAAKIDQAATPRGMDYSATVFFERPPFSSRILTQHRCVTKSEYTTLVNEVRKRKNYLYYGTAKKDGSKYIAIPPFILDWDTVPEHPADIAKAIAPPDPARWGGDLSCPFCHTEVLSTAGRTLHVKSAHLDRIEEYNALLAKINTKPTIEPDEEDVVDLISDKLDCPYCRHKLNSTSGRTLHIKSKHPEKFAEHQQGSV